MQLDLEAITGTVILGTAFVLSARAYRHADQRYVDGKTERIHSPSHFSAVYRWIQLSTLIAGVGAYLFQHPFLLDLHRDPALFWVGQVLTVLGLSLFVASKRALGQAYSPCFDSWVSPHIVEVGPYRRIRHPIYTANVLLLSGVAIGTGSLWLALNPVILAGYYAVAARREEAALEAHHPEYAGYQRRSGRFLPNFGSSVGAQLGTPEPR